MYYKIGQGSKFFNVLGSQDSHYSRRDIKIWKGGGQERELWDRLEIGDFRVNSWFIKYTCICI